jgi:alpha-beta hydrolase superfamily lysophospholipase
MEQKSGTWISDQNENIYFQTWDPATAPIGCILIVHGLGEHCGRYDHVAKWFNNKGYLVQSFDLPGHGKSDGVRGHIESFTSTHAIINHFISQLTEAHPDMPMILYGHSMGGEIVLHYGFSNSQYVDGIISSSPGLIPGNPPSPVIIALSQILQKIMPKNQIDNNLPLEGLSRDQKVIDDYKADPLVHSLLSMRLGAEILNNGKKMIDHAAEFPNIPLLLQVGEKDRLVAPEGPIQFAKNKPGQECKVWEGFFHELHNEPEQEQIFEYMLKWMQTIKVIRQ